MNQYNNKFCFPTSYTWKVICRKPHVIGHSERSESRTYEAETIEELHKIIKNDGYVCTNQKQYYKM